MGADRKRAFSAALEAAVSLRTAQSLDKCSCRGDHPPTDSSEEAADTVGPPTDLQGTAASAGLPEDSDARRVEEWRWAVESLAASAKNAVDRKELSELLSGEQAGPMLPRCELKEHGKRPFLVTAPHSIYVLRDGHTPHLVEPRTSEIARGIATELEGTSLQWTEKQQRSSKNLWDIAEQNGLARGALLDPRNRDPNYLSTGELPTNPWYQLMRSAALGWSTAFGADQAMLHIDIHGCKDPPETPSHLTVGLGAMLEQAERSGGPVAVARVHAFGVALKTALAEEVLGLGPLKPTADPVRVLLPYGGSRGSINARFSGTCPETGRHTQSQQAVAFAGFSHSVQLEMSRSLRHALTERKNAPLRFSHALVAAWAKAKRSGEAAGFVRRPDSEEYAGLVEL